MKMFIKLIPGFLFRLLSFMCIMMICLPAMTQDFNSAVKLYESGKYDEAFKIFSSVKKGTPQYAECRYKMGMISMHKRLLSDAEDYFGQAVAANDKIASYHIAMVSLYGQIITDANPLRQAILAPKIKSHLEAAALIDPANLGVRVMLLGFYIRAPRIMGGDIEKAKKTADDIMKIDRAEGNRALGMVAQFEEKPADAERFFRTALLLTPDSVKHYTQLASFFQLASRYDEALDIYEKAVVKFPKNRNMLYQAGRVAAMSGTKNGEKGKKYLSAFIEQVPDKSNRNLANAYYFLGVIEKDRKNTSAALGYFNAALKINPNHRQSKEAIDAMK